MQQTQQKDITLSFELFPPKEDKKEMFWKVVDTISDFKPSFISVTCGAGGTVSQNQETADLVRGIQEKKNIPAAAHLTSIGKTRADIDTLAQNYWESGIKRIVALRGDMPNMDGSYVPNPEGYAYASDLISALKNIAPFDISVAGYPEKHPEATSLQSDIDNLKRKVDAGADRVITQFFFDNDAFLRYRDLAVKQGVNIPIVPGILPIINFKRAASFAEKCGAYIPEQLAELFEKANDQSDITQMIGAYFAVEQCQNLHAEGLNDFHFFTLNAPKMLRLTCFTLTQMNFKNFQNFLPKAA